MNGVVNIMGSWWEKKQNFNLRDELQLEYKYNNLKELRGLMKELCCVWCTIMIVIMIYFFWQDFAQKVRKNKDFPVFSWFK